MNKYTFTEIGFGTPLNERILLYWEDFKHIEDGVLSIDGGDIFHELFDGGCLDEQPTHWCYIPEVKEI